MIVYTRKITPRLQYITDFIGREITGYPFELTDDPEFFNNCEGPRINYSHSTFQGCQFSICNCSLLFETGISEQKIECFEFNGLKAFFKTTGDYPFDIFAAGFYLLSRYEEYLPHKKDVYGRYAHENSLAGKEGFLNLPLVNCWVEDFKKTLKEKFSMLNMQTPAFGFVPTYDIDEAFSYRHKSLIRTIGGIVKSIVNAEWSKLKERFAVLRGKTPDPFDSFDRLDELHTKHKLHPVYFFHVAAANARFDKNNLPAVPAMQSLIGRHAAKYPVGIHPSWQSGDDENMLQSEIATLENITGKKISSSRYHYIRFNLPEGYRRLIRHGISHDYSMGYGSINGFRASVATPFYWYDLEKEETTRLLLHPYCFMDASSFFEQQFSPQQAFEEMIHYYKAVKAVNGILIILWHNTFLGTDKLYAGWAELYRQFLQTISPAEV